MSDQEKAPARLEPERGAKSQKAFLRNTLPTTTQGIAAQAPIGNILNPPPQDGIHTWVMESAWACRKAGLSPNAAVGAIIAYDGSMRRRLQPREAHNAVERAYSVPLEGRAPADAARKLEWNKKETARLVDLHGTTNACLWHRSPMIPDDGLTQDIILRHLFPDPAGLLCIGKTIAQFHTGPRPEHTDMERCQHIVPAYMIAREGLTQEGKLSMHSKENTGPRRYIVCDFDEPPPAQHASIITQLATFRPLAMVVHSGNKSLHAWFPVLNPNDDEVFWKIAVTLGADAAIWRNPASFVRLPLGMRDNQKRQEVLYFNPSAVTQ